MSLRVEPDLLQRAEQGPVTATELAGCVRTSLPYAYNLIAGLAGRLEGAAPTSSTTRCRHRTSTAAGSCCEPWPATRSVGRSRSTSGSSSPSRIAIGLLSSGPSGRAPAPGVRVGAKPDPEPAAGARGLLERQRHNGGGERPHHRPFAVVVLDQCSARRSRSARTTSMPPVMSLMRLKRRVARTV